MSELIVSKDFYVYVHRKATTGKVFYVGKGSGKRAWAKQGRSKKWANIVDRCGLVVDVVAGGLQEWYAFELEVSLIAYYGIDTLCNIAQGGQGISGTKFSAETRKKMSAARIGMKFSESHRASLSLAHKGKPSNEGTLANLRKMAKERQGRPLEQKHYNAVFGATAKKTVCIETGQVFNSAKAAAAWLSSTKRQGAKSQHISKAARGIQPHAYGFHWRYANAGVIS